MSEGPQNAQPPAQFGPGSNRRTADEDRAWAQLYASVGQAPTAEEVVKQLDADAEARRSHLALYLRAKTTLRERRVADARNQRIGAFVRSVVAIVVIGPFRLLRSLLSTGSVTAAAARMHLSTPAMSHALARARQVRFAIPLLWLGLALAGVQVFIASHSFFLLKELELLSRCQPVRLEYRACLVMMQLWCACDNNTLWASNCCKACAIAA